MLLIPSSAHNALCTAKLKPQPCMQGGARRDADDPQ